MNPPYQTENQEDIGNTSAYGWRLPVCYAHAQRSYWVVGRSDRCGTADRCLYQVYSIPVWSKFDSLVSRVTSEGSTGPNLISVATAKGQHFVAAVQWRVVCRAL